uniref:Uncharacterized protein n=1 Tax=Arundo donax TaxID=35708 RepID=A0A0A9A8X7_ARUDO
MMYLSSKFSVAVRSSNASLSSKFHIENTSPLSTLPVS